MRRIILGLFFFIALESLAQPYKPAATKVNDLVHTRLDLHFDYNKCYVLGKAWLTLRTHFYPTDSLRLDAKGMDLKTISVVKSGYLVPLQFSYDSLTIDIKLDRVYRKDEKYTIYLNYTAKPNNRGLYFINPKGVERGVPTQIWTSGEPDNNSCWFPTIDQPNQKCTDEIDLTVPSRDVTLSNGRLAGQHKNADGTRTDKWKMHLPQTPYSFMIAVGNFQVARDSWLGKPVEYYMEPKYAADAKAIFGYTPEAMTFFSKILGVDYPWNKYAQIRVRGFNGGLENSSATEFNEDGETSPRDLADLPYQSGYVHELFHQWFGDYVTCKDWGNLALNESFADLAEILWAEYKYGQDVADEHFYQRIQGYFDNQKECKESLIRDRYADKGEMFDGVTYQKGGRILDMLRHFLGNAAFYKGLHLYLTAHAFGNADAQELRLAMEEASGLDLNWFFNQWFYGAGHPILDIAYHWDNATKTQNVYLRQIQEGQIFSLPMWVDIYTGNSKIRYNIWMRHQSDTLSFSLPAKPDLVNVDAEKVLLAKKIDHKNIEEFAFQYAHAPLYVDRMEAIEAASPIQSDSIAQHILISALNDKYDGIRIQTMELLDLSNKTLNNAALPVLLQLAEKNSNNLVRSTAIVTLAKANLPNTLDLYKQALDTSTSYAVRGAALNAIQQIDPKEALKLAKKHEAGSKGVLRDAIITIYCQNGGDSEWPYVYYSFADPGSPLQYRFTGRFASLTGSVTNPAFAQQGIDAIANLVIELRKYNNLSTFIKILEQVKAARLKLNDSASAAYVDKAISRVKASE